MRLNVCVCVCLSECVQERNRREMVCWWAHASLDVDLHSSIRLVCMCALEHECLRTRMLVFVCP